MLLLLNYNFFSSYFVVFPAAKAKGAMKHAI